MAIGETYEEFVEKFKPKHTTDDCFTPNKVYEAVAGYVSSQYGVARNEMCRPFWPDGDYESFDYSGKVVVDNPPFSILKKIVDFYIAKDVKFWLFAPALTSLGTAREVTLIATGVGLTYQNGAIVSTSFVTNLEDNGVAVKSQPELYRVLKDIDAANRHKQAKQTTKLAFPPELLTGAMVNYMSIHGVEYSLRRSDCTFVRKLDNYSKSIFGGGYLLSEKAAAEKAAAEKAAAEKAAAEKVELSERERCIIRRL